MDLVPRYTVMEDPAESVDCGTCFALYLGPAGLRCLPLIAVQELPDNRHEAMLAPHSAAIPHEGWHWGKAAGSEDLPEDALCYGDAIQYRMQDSSELSLQLAEGQQLI